MRTAEVAALLQRYAAARGGQFRRQDFVTWAVKHGMPRTTPEIDLDLAFLSAQSLGHIERVPGLEAELHPLFRSTRSVAAIPGGVA